MNPTVASTTIGRQSPPATPVGPYVCIGADNAVRCGACVIGGREVDGPELARRVAAALNLTRDVSAEHLEKMARLRPYQRECVLAAIVNPVGSQDDDDRHL